MAHEMHLERAVHADFLHAVLSSFHFEMYLSGDSGQNTASIDHLLLQRLKSRALGNYLCHQQHQRLETEDFVVVDDAATVATVNVAEVVQ